MDNCKGGIPKFKLNGGRIATNEQLDQLRAKARETLEWASRNEESLKAPRLINGPRSCDRSPDKSTGLNGTDYVPYYRPNEINISELVTDKTIHLESTSTNDTPRGSPKNLCSFDPSEMNGRSTSYCRDLRRNISNYNELLRVEQILASSISKEVRDLCESLRESNSNFKSLPRTADLSQSSKASDNLNGFSLSNFNQTNISGISSDEFAPIDLMQSKLLKDEYSWEQKYACIPKMSLNSMHSKNNKKSTSRDIQDSRMSSISTNGFDSDFSFGSYFGKNSENIGDILSSRNPPIERQPVALAGYTSTASSSSCDQNNATYRFKSIQSKKDLSDSIQTSTDNPYLLSMSTIRRAIADIQTEDSEGTVVDRLLQAKKEKSPNIITQLRNSEAPPSYKKCQTEKSSEIDVHRLAQVKKEKSPSNREIQTDNSGGAAVYHCLQTNKEKSGNNRQCLKEKSEGDKENRLSQPKKEKSTGGHKSSIRNIEDVRDFEFDRMSGISVLSSVRSEKSVNMDNKENQKPRCIESLKLSETASLTESLLNSSEMKRLEITYDSFSRDLSPTDSTDTPRNAQNQPHQTHFLDVPQNIMDSQWISPISSKTKPEEHKKRMKHPSPKDLDDSTPKRKRSPPSGSYGNENTPLLSSASSQLSSPTWSDRSPQFNSTTNSDRQYLLAGRSSYPDMGKFSLPNYALIGKASSIASVKSGSRCTNTSEFSQREGSALPLKATCLQISWGSTRLRKNVKKSMQIKNTSFKKLKIKIDVSGPGFQITNTQSNIIALLSQECRTIDVNFCPTVIGAAAGVLSISSASSPIYDTPLVIPLFGYGGASSIILRDIIKGPIGCPFLIMGEFKDLSGPIDVTFKIFNKGPLYGFAVITVDSSGLDIPRLHEVLDIIPNKILLPPEKEISVRVVFRPRREDMKRIIKKISKVMTLANMRIICGDEPSRQRIRALIKCMDDGTRQSIPHSFENLWGKLPNEKSIDDVCSLKEKSETALDLIADFRVHEIALTLNHTLYDETIDSSIVFPDADETVIFKTFYCPSNKMDITPEEINGNECEEWSVRPNILRYGSNMKFTLKNKTRRHEKFSISCNYSHLFKFSPGNGFVEAGKELEIHVINCLQKHGVLPNAQIYILVSMRNKNVQIPVEVNKSSS